MEISYAQSDLTGGNLSYAWPGMAVDDQGKPTTHSGTGDRSVQVFGTFGVGGHGRARVDRGGRRHGYHARRARGGLAGLYRSG